jgi:hypothetical protein
MKIESDIRSKDTHRYLEDMNQLRSFFGKDAHIEQTESGDFFVSYSLLSGALMGGQSVEANIRCLGNEQKRFDVLALSVNGYNFVDEIGQLRVAPNRKKNVELNQVHSWGSETEKSIISNDAVINKRTGLVFLRRLTLADDLAILLHEMGHRLSKFGSDSSFVNLKELEKMNVVKKGVLRKLLWLIGREWVADREALLFVEKLEKKDVYLFERDNGCKQLRSFLTVGLDSYVIGANELMKRLGIDLFIDIDDLKF